MLKSVILGFVLSLLVVFPASAVEEPAGFRDKTYRAPTPQTITGGTTITPQQAKEIHDKGDAIFVDTYETTTQWIADFKEWAIGEAHDSLPGAYWFPGTGIHPLKPMMEAYLKKSLKEVTKGNKDQKIVIFCRSDCWLGWNVAKRAIGYGYTNILWMRDGTDGWAEAGYPMVDGEPYPLEE
ncbi:MAG: rhodanese-like domain-containing protein [Rhodospirillales bacterium]|nr:rhodanese-like domain-containing protein [Rhodospirillales bacterium]